MISYPQFRANEMNQPVNVDNAYGNQCWDLVALYDEQVIGIPASNSYGLPTGPDLDARDVWTYFEDPLPQYFDKVGAPFQPGDIIVWGFNPDGHIAIFDHDVDVNTFVSFDQNWPVGSYAHLQSHNYSNVLGALRVKGADMSTVGEIEFHDLYEAMFGPMAINEPTDGDRKRWIGAETNTVIRSMQDDPRHPAWLAYIKDLQNATPPPVNVVPYSGPQLYEKK